MVENMTQRRCIYCYNFKDESEFSLEHAIPRFLGGAFSPDYFKTNDVCKTCNRNLGLFVDAGFAKDYLVNHALADNSYTFFDPQTTKALPLRCMGTLAIEVPHLKNDEICELWLGPLGEQVFWVRPNDKRLYWYVGGNPTSAKQFQTKAYYIFSERSKKNIALSINTFRQSFKKQKVKKILCTKTDIQDLSKIGFSEPDETDHDRINFLNSIGSRQKKASVSMNIKFDHRFLAKLSLGISYCLFGEKVLEHEYAHELRKGLWYKETDPVPNLLGTMNLNKPDKFLKEVLGIKGGVAICLMMHKEGLSMNLNISEKMHWTALTTPSEILSSEDMKKIGDGKIYLLFQDIQQCISTNLPKFIAHKTSPMKIQKLSDIEHIMDKNKNYFKEL